MRNFKNKFLVLTKQLDIKVNNIEIFFEAFTHPSYANENTYKKNYERLEFLGDAILDFLVGEYIFLHNDCQEGELTKIRSKYVCEDANASYCKELKLDSCLLVGKGAQKQKENEKVSVLGNLFESFLGALYLDQGMDSVRKILQKFIFPKIENHQEFFVDYKSLLQEEIQAGQRKDIEYRVILEKGPAHDKTFEVEVRHDGLRLGVGVGKTKRDAEQHAAKDALSKRANI